MAVVVPGCRPSCALLAPLDPGSCSPKWLAQGLGFEGRLLTSNTIRGTRVAVAGGYSYD